MIKTIFGIIILLNPFLLVLKFKDRKKGFFYVLTFLTSFHLFVATTTQLLGVFSYPNIIIINLILNFIVIYKTNFKTNYREVLIKIEREIKNNWILIITIFIIFIELYSVHFNYTGKVSDIENDFFVLKDVKNMKYVYPYFSDEWIAVSLINYSIENKKLPFVNPLWKNSYFPNFESAFHSFLSEFFLILNLNPLTSYTFLTIFFELIICFLVYSFLRINQVSKFASAVSSLSIPLITNSGILPTFWFLIPITLGLVCLILTFIFISFKDKKIIFLSSFLTLIFYPPLAIFLTPILIFYFLNEKKNLLFCFLLFFSILLLFIFSGSPINNFNFILSKIYYLNFTKNYIPNYSIWKVLPFFSLIFAVLGLSKLKNKEFIFIPTFIGLAFWTLYSKILWRIVIDYDRVVLTISLLIIIISGFGIDTFFNLFKNKKTKNILVIVIFSYFIFYAFNYTNFNQWEEIKINGINIPPANIYLKNEEIELFKNITGKVFISHPWKALVIGVATENYPLDSKPSFITNQIFKYEDFIKLNCEEKKEAALNYGIDYVYSKSFDCDSFKFIGKYNSFYLYEFKK